ncbi:MAG: GNAT family N-acetyltransferase [Christensenellaceae bacterium]|jgi:predicted acetyltransferase|nr:GNAT family N-acetyltransferase [Christensenellaceae bacterium]
MDKLKLVKPSAEYKDDIEDFKANMGGFVHGVARLNEMSVDEWLEFLKTTPEGWVPATQFMTIRERDGKIISMINLRHELNADLLHHGGHIGYMVRPDERRKGYNKEQVRLCLIKAKEMGIGKLLITCFKWNEGSRKTILASGGVFENEVEKDGEIFERYWIDLTNSEGDCGKHIK